MSKHSDFLVLIALTVLIGGSVYAEDWKVGEKWTYQHQGPRPYSDGTTTVKGDRTVELTAIQGEGDQKRYLLKNQWGAEDANPATSHIDAKNMIHKIDIQAMAVLTLDPPVPALWALKVGEEKTLKTKMDFAGFALTVEYKAERLPDESLTVPAGTFKNCQHLQIVSTMQSDMMPTTKNKNGLLVPPQGQEPGQGSHRNQLRSRQQLHRHQHPEKLSEVRTSCAGAQA